MRVFFLHLAPFCASQPHLDGRTVHPIPAGMTNFLPFNSSQLKLHPSSPYYALPLVFPNQSTEQALLSMNQSCFPDHTCIRDLGFPRPLTPYFRPSSPESPSSAIYLLFPILWHREPLVVPSLACAPLRSSHPLRCFSEEREGGNIWQECSRDLGASQPE